MALAIDSQEASSAGHRSITSPTTWTFVNTAGTLILVGVVITATGGGAAAITAVTYGGDALTAIGSGQSFDTNDTLVQWFYRLNPKTGSNTVSISWTTTGAFSPAGLGGAISFTGNHASTPVGSEVKATGNGTAPDSGAVTSTSGNYIVSVGGSGSSGTFTPTSPDVMTFDLSGSGSTGGDNIWASYFSSSGASHNMLWTIPSDLWGIVAVEVKAAAGGGTQFTSSLSASLTFTGLIVRGVQKPITGQASFSGSVVKSTRRLLSGQVTFIGGVGKRLSRALGAALSFTGSTIRAVAKIVLGQVSFTGSVQKSVSRTFGASLSFVGSITKRISRSFTGSMSFVGGLATSFISGAFHVYTQAFTATVSFSGSVSKGIARKFTASLGVSGTGIGPSVIMVGNRLALRISNFLYELLN